MEALEMTDAEEPRAKPPAALRWAHAALYVPVLLLMASTALRSFYVLAHGYMAGLYGIPYLAAFVYLAVRARRASRGEIEKAWLDALLLAVAGALWAFLVYSQFV